VARLEQLKAEMKGNDYTYDLQGQVIAMEPLAPDRLPPFQQQPRLGLSDGAPPPAAAPGGRKGGRGKGGGRGGGRGGTRLEFGGASTFQELDSLQPPLLDTMDVHAGVLLTQGDGTKGGEVQVFDGDRMSKEAFEKVIATTGAFTRRAVGADPAATVHDDPLLDSANLAPAHPPTTPLSPGGASATGMFEAEVVPVAQRPAFMPPSPEPGEKLGARNSYIRERGGMPTKTRLPAPPIGETTGHGLLTSSQFGSQEGSVDAAATKVLPAGLKTSNPNMLRDMLE
jgi:hypothetical protein